MFETLNPQKPLNGEALLRRMRELDAEIAQHERNLREGEARADTNIINLSQLCKNHFATPCPDVLTIHSY
jgi:hypothetical protein